MTTEGDIRAHVERLLGSVASGRDVVPALSGLLGLWPRHELDDELRRRIDDTVLEKSVASYETLGGIARALETFRPELLSVPPLLGAVHLGVAVGRFAPFEALDLVRGMLAGEGVHHLVVDWSGATLLARLRMARLCSELATLARQFGRRKVLAREGWQLADAAIEHLFMDRDPVVGVCAAWAAGVRLSARSAPKRLVRIFERCPRDVEHGRWRRRKLAALTALSVFAPERGHEAAFFDALREGVGREDPSARVVAIRALGLAWRAAPDLARGLIEELVASGGPELLRNAAEVALRTSEPTRAELLERIRERALESEAIAYPPLRFLIGPRSRVAEELFQHVVGMREAALASPLAAARQADLALQWLADLPESPLADDVEEACDELLFNVTSLRDAMLVAPDALRRTMHDRYDAVILRARRRRGQHALDPNAAPAVRRDRLWRLTRALDGSPRGVRDGDAASVALGEDAARIAQGLVRAAGEANIDPMLDRPLALALITALERAVSTHRLGRDDVLAALLALPSVRMLRHSRDISIEEVRALVVGVVALREAMAAVARGDAPDDAGESLFLRIRDLSAQVRGAALHEDDPTWQAMSMMVRAVARYRRARRGHPDSPVLAALVELVDRFGAVHQRLEERLGCAPWRALSADEVAPAARVLLEGAGFTTVHAEKPPSAHDARNTLRRGLPPALRDLVDALFAIPLASDPTPPPPADGPYRPGRRIGDYVVDERLGEGGMGWCLMVKRRLEAEQPSARRFVLKLPRKEAPLGAFRDEALALIELSKAPHDAIVGFIAYVDYGLRRPFLVMRHAEGITLLEHLHAEGPLPLEGVVEVGARVGEALVHCHAMRVSHQDLKPDNIVLEHGSLSRPVLVDWGLAGAATKHYAGTAEYCAPERWKPKGVALPGGPSDVYALACILYELRTGRELLGGPLTNADFPAEPDALRLNDLAGDYARMAIAQRLAEDGEATYRRVRAHVAEAALAKLLCDMLLRNPPERPEAAAVVEELRRILGRAALG